MAASGRPAGALTLRDITSGMEVIYHYNGAADRLTIVEFQPRCSDFTVASRRNKANLMSVRTLRVRGANGRVTDIPLFLLGLASGDDGNWSDNYLTRA